MATGHRQRHRGAERIGAAELVAGIVAELARLAAHALLVQVPGRMAAVGQLVLLPAAAITALHAAEAGADLLRGEHPAQVHAQFAVAEARQVGHASGDGGAAAQRHAYTGHGGHLAIELVAAALAAAAALHEPLHAAVGPVAALVEGRFFAAYQHAVFVDAQGDGVVAEREAPRIDLVDAGLQVI